MRRRLVYVMTTKTVPATSPTLHIERSTNIPSTTNHAVVNKTTQLPRTYHSTSTVVMTTTVIRPSTTSSTRNDDMLVLGISIPLGILVGICLLGCMMLCCRWYKRKRRLLRDLKPYYEYDQTEADVVDGILYTSQSNSTDMLCVVADNPRTIISADEGDEVLLINDNHYPIERHNGTRLNSVAV